MPRLKIKKGDSVLITSGKDRGRVGKIIRTMPSEGRVVVEGANIRKKHARARKGGKKGQIVQFPAPLASSSVKMVCPKCKKASRVGYVHEEGRKKRICKKCKNAI